MKNNIIRKIIMLLLFINVSILSQNIKFNNNLFAEAFGNGGAYSLNYDRIIFDNLSARFGVSLLKSNDELLQSFPILINYRFYQNSNYIELGIGTTIFTLPLDLGNFTDDEINGSLVTGVLSYCFQSEMGLNGRIAFTPFYYENKFIPFGGFSFGYSF